MKERGWVESNFFCTACGQVVTHRTWENGFMALRCRCLKKAGHGEVVPAAGWIDRRCQGDEEASRLEMMQANSTTCFD